MKKIAWPWIGTTEHEMGSMSRSFRDVDQSPYTGYDSLVPEKSLTEETDPSMGYSESRVSPVDNDGETVSLADDEIEEDEDSTIVSIFNEKKKVAKFKCDIAQSFQEKINGLQVYSSLNNDCGLLFPYDRPQDVLYHMGTVKFPIDIIFLDQNNKIKKICKNITPGTLGTFGCANVLNVLEVVGGSAEKLNLKIGDTVKIQKGRNSLSKSAKLKTSPKIIYVYNFDGLIEKNPQIKISKIMSYDEDNITIGINEEIFTPGESILIHAHELDNYPNYSFSKTASGLNEFLENSEEIYEIHTDLKETFKDPNNLVIFSTASQSSRKVIEAFLSKLEVLYGSFKRKDVNIVKISKESDHINLIEDLRSLYPYSEIRLFADNTLAKKAGVPVPNDVKEKAKGAIKSLNLAEEVLEKSVSAIKQNLREYEKIRNREDKIKKTQGQYHQSIKRNVETAKQYLLSIRDAIKILNQIKDATTTIEIIESLASSSQIVSESIQEIFNLVNEMDTPDFVMLLTEATTNYEKAAEDLEFTIERAVDYINTHILGIIVLST